MIALNRNYVTVREYQADKTSSYLKDIGDFLFRPLQNATMVKYGGPVLTLSESAKKTLEKLNEFKALQENWDSYQAARPSLAAIRQAEKMVRSLDAQDMPVFFTAPGPNGEIVLELKMDQKAVEIYFYEDEPSDFFLYEGNKNIGDGLIESNLDQIIHFLR